MINKEQQRIEARITKMIFHPNMKAYTPLLVFGDNIIVDPSTVDTQGFLGIKGNPYPETAWTDGRDTYWHPDFVKKLSSAELTGVILHELMHKMYMHFLTMRPHFKDDRMLANLACDYAINLEIIEMQKALNEKVERKGQFIQLPICGDCQGTYKYKGKPCHHCPDCHSDGSSCEHPNKKVSGVLDERFRGLTSAEIYRILKKESLENGGPSQYLISLGMPGDGSNPNFDEHGWDEVQKLTKQELADLGDHINDLIHQGKMMALESGEEVPRSFDELTKVTIPWEERLANFITNTCVGKDYSTWKKPNRKYLASGIYLPSQISEKVGWGMFAVDTSGSISNQMVQMVLSEGVSLMKTVSPERLDLVYWDTRVAQHEVYFEEEYDKMLNETKPAGGGGTDPECIEKYMEDKKLKPDFLVVMTDGYVGSWGNNWNCPVLWVVFDNEGATAPNGVTIHISSADYV